MSNAAGVHPPLQERSRRAWSRILDAGVELIEERGFEALTIGTLCDRAGVTPPTIYARAAGKQALLLALYEHALERIGQSDTLDPEDPRWRELPPREVVAEAVAGLARIWLDNAALMRAIVRHSNADPDTLHRGSVASIDAARRFRRVLTSRPDLVGGKDAELRVDACFRIVYAALVQRVMFGAGFESDLPLTDEELQATLIAMAIGYLFADEEAR